jgi:para-aminobenzoate synthetase component 1
VNQATATFQVNDIQEFKLQVLNWADRFNIFILLDSHQYQSKYSTEEWIVAADALDTFSPPHNTLSQLGEFLQTQKGWLFGHIAYDLGSQIEPVASPHPDHIQFPDLFLFQPRVMVRQTGDEITITASGQTPEAIFQEIRQSAPSTAPKYTRPEIQPKIDRAEYLRIIRMLKEHIQRGDCYEINFCQEFFAENASIDPLALYRQLVDVSPMPFGGFYKLNDKYLLCASPERFLQKSGNTIISQPIKGTIRRDLQNKTVDLALAGQLRESQKDKSENVMVVDLVRNDLSKVCKEASVQVDELYGIYSFPQVHQMISTVSGELQDGIDLPAILRATFPMGSMTGAPKRRVMELIAKYEKTKRGIYSGCIGYITPGKDFDFNVVIRSLMYNETTRYLSYQVGGGITFYSDPEKEYEECLLKAEAIKKVLQ